MASNETMKHKQHYVWKHYLSSWADNEKIFCLRDNNLFRPNIVGTAQKRDFYRVKELNQDDVALVSAFIRSFPANLQKLQRQMLSLFLMPHHGKELIGDLLLENSESNGAALMHLKNLDSKFDVMINNLEEEIHSEIEYNSVKFLEYIRTEDVSFWDNPEDRLEFLQFIVMQMLRTKKIQDKLYKTIDESNATHDTLKNIWGILRHLLAMNVSSNLHSDQSYRITLLLNEGALPLITSDQPVINTRSIATHKLHALGDFELYYPVTPRKAILISNTDNSHRDNTVFLNEQEVENYNNLMFEESHEQIYSNSETVLKKFME